MSSSVRLGYVAGTVLVATLLRSEAELIHGRQAMVNEREVFLGVRLDAVFG